MTRLDRYLLRQLIVAFGFFLLVFTGVVWLTQAVRLIDTVVASGRGGAILLEFSAFVLPDVLVIVLPLSGMGAALYTLNKLYSESELVVMMTAGVGPGRVLRPVAVFGGLVAAAMAVTVNLLVPLGGAALAERTQELRSDLASALIVERQFIHPATGLTLFIASADGAEMSGVFLHDQRDPERPVTYSANAAVFLREGFEARLVMRDGVALAFAAEGGTLSAVEYEQLVFDLSELIEPERNRAPRPAEYSVRQLLDPTPAMLGKAGAKDRGRFIAEAHYKITLPLLAWLYPPVALVTLLAGGYRRSGFGRRVIVAVGVAVLMQATAIVTRARVQDDASLWPAMYLPILIGLAYVGVLLWRLSRPWRPRRAALA